MCEGEMEVRKMIGRWRTKMEDRERKRERWEMEEKRK